MPLKEFQPTIQIFERYETIHALDRENYVQICNFVHVKLFLAEDSTLNSSKYLRIEE